MSETRRELVTKNENGVKQAEMDVAAKLRDMAVFKKWIQWKYQRTPLSSALGSFTLKTKQKKELAD